MDKEAENILAINKSNANIFTWEHGDVKGVDPWTT